MRSEKFEFLNAKGENLAAVLDLPFDEPKAFALLAHCFTCGKDIRAARYIAERLTQAGMQYCVSTSPGSAPAKASSPTPISPPTSPFWWRPRTILGAFSARRRS